MKFKITRAILCSVMLLGFSTVVHADDIPIIDDAFDLIDTGVGIGTDIVGALSPVTTVAEGVNDLTRTVTKTTTVQGDVHTEVRAGQITQEITSGEGSSNDLNLGSVSGGAFVGGSFRANVEVGDITQKLHGANNHNAANIGSISR